MASLNMFSRVFWDEVVTDKIVSPFLNRLDPVGEKGLLSLWRDHLSSLLVEQNSSAQQPNKAVVAAPKKKTNYQVFFSLMHPIIKKDQPSVSFRDISKVVSQKWHELSPDQKAAYVDQTSQIIRPPPPILQTAPPAKQPAAVDFQEEDDAFQILAGGGADVVHDDASSEDSGIDEEEEDEVYDITDNEEEYDDDDDASDHFDDDNDSKISITDDP